MGTPSFDQTRALLRALGQAPVRSDDTMPRKILRGRREDLADEPRRMAVDVAVGPHESLRNRAHAFDYPPSPRVVTH
jgi:hypothetical protein